MGKNGREREGNKTYLIKEPQRKKADYLEKSTGLPNKVKQIKPRDTND